MTIREIEEKTGLTRANIRFYEQEGLVSPRREANGYRDYSEENVETLKRIRLLRALQVSIDEIRALQKGESELDGILLEKMAELERQQAQAEAAERVCREIRADEASYGSLDAQKYLDSLEREKPLTGWFERMQEKDAPPPVSYPWRRFFARTVDLWIYYELLELFLVLVFKVNLSGMHRLLKFGMVVYEYVAMALVEPLLLHLWGTTPGKLIFGLRLESEDGGRLSYARASERTMCVLWRGMGWAIPIYNLYCLGKSFAACADGELLPWEGMDSGVVYTIKDKKRRRFILVPVVYALLTFAVVIAELYVQLPPNRGELTVSQFVENYNFYVKRSGMGMVLDDFGQPTAAGNGYVVINLGGADVQFTYVEDGGVLTAVCLDAYSSGGFVYGQRADIQLAALAFAGAQKGLGMFGPERTDMLEYIEDRAFEDFSYTLKDVVLNCDVEYKGYELWDSGGSRMLVPIDGQAQEFSMHVEISKN